MNSVTLNITAIVLLIAGSIVVYGSNIWFLLNGALPVVKYVTVSSSNIVGMFSVTVGCILTQINIYNLKQQLETTQYRIENNNIV